MKTSKSIERLFQESFNDFQSSPSPKVWSGIEEKLAEKRQRRRVLPFWWQVASIAAILMIFSSIGALYYNTSGKKPSVASSQKISKFKSSSNSLEVIPTQYRFLSVHKNLSTLENSIESSLAFQITEPEVNSLAEGDASRNLQQSDQSVRLGLAASKEQKRIAQSLLPIVDRLKRSFINPFPDALMSSTLLKTHTNSNNKKKSLFDAVEESNLAEVEDSKTIDKPWAVQPNIAPVFMNSFNGGNPVEPSLQGKTSSSPNVSYGVNVAYAINKKIKIRTGVNQVAMGYNTQDVMLTTNSPRSSLAIGHSSSNVETNLVGDFSLVSAPLTSNQSLQSRELTTTFESLPSKMIPVGAVNHELGFVEVPLEVEYALIDNKIGVHVLGGASTYVLNNNEIFFEENGRSSSIGEANNLNTLSFSANLGVGMDYNFSERISFNLEPKFLYQINTFQTNSTNFQPYFLGIYSGIKFKF